MYRPVEKSPHFPTLEQRILSYWEETRAFELQREKNRGRPIWSFLDGPITANNPMGVHHAWGRSLKDMYQRYHAMCGHQLRYQNGFDCQGLWVEVEVEKEHGFKSKRDIEAYGVARFVEDCKERVRKFSRVQTEQSIRLGYWMDWDDSYFTMGEVNNYCIWNFLERCHDHGYIYKGFDSMPWCPRCGVGLSQMEMHEGYKWVKDLSVIVRFPLRRPGKEALLVWTTTPWTLTANVAAAVHPEMTYYKVRQDEWTYYVGAENWDGKRVIELDEEGSSGKRRRTVTMPTLLQHLEKHGETEVIGKLQGAELVGLEYDGPYDALPAQQEPGGYPYRDPARVDATGTSCHRVIAWKEVTGSEGTGIVHIAPGCGREDYELSRELGLVAISPLDESGHFLPKFDWLEGRDAHDVGRDIVVDLEERGILLANETFPHRYAHCWRCGTAILYRLVDEWYISMEWRDRIVETVPQVRWIPEFGEQLELDWLRNMGDWMISKKRYWGLALPIWQCNRHGEPEVADRCDWFTVIGSREQLAERATSGWGEFEGHTPHRPWIDAVKVRCERCGGEASRIPDVGNPWLDAGIVPYSTMGFADDPERFKDWFPADLVLECFPGQFRNWFYSMLAMNTMMQDDRWQGDAPDAPRLEPPFRTLLGHASVRDERGNEMHKSLGNSIEFNIAAETVGAEVMRYIFAAQNPVHNLNFPDISEGRDTKVVHHDQEVSRKLLTWWNCYSFYVTYASVDGITPEQLAVPPAARSELDRWILSKLQGLIGLAHECFQEYRHHQLMARFERFLDDLSKWYLRRSRRRFWKSESDTDKLAAYATLYDALEGLCRIMAPVFPFLTEEIYQNVVRSVQPSAPVSVHLLDYPEVDPALVDAALEARIDTVVRYKNLGLSLRSKASIKTRQPLGRMIIRPENEAERTVLGIDGLRAQLLEEVNVKTLELVESTDGLVEVVLRPNFKTLGRKHGAMMPQIKSHLATVSPAVVQAALAADGIYRLSVEGSDPVELSAEDLDIRYSSAEGLTFQMEQGGVFAALDTTITPELEQEGIARDFVRGVQNYRKGLDLQVADRIVLRFHASEATVAAIRTWADYIRRETLALELEEDTTLTADGGREFKAGGAKVVVGLETVGTPSSG